MHKFLLLALVLLTSLPASARIIRVDAFDCRGSNMQPGTNECWDRPSFQDASSSFAEWGVFLTATLSQPFRPFSSESLIRRSPDFVSPQSQSRFDVLGTGSFAQTQSSSVIFGATYFNAFDLVGFFAENGRGYDPTVEAPRTGRLILKPELGATDIQVAWGIQNTDPSDTSETRYLDPSNPARMDPDDLPLFRVTWSFDNLRQVLIDQAHYSALEANDLLNSIFELDGPLHTDALGRPVPTVQLISALSASGEQIVELTGLKSTRYSSSAYWDGAQLRCFEFTLASGGEPSASCSGVVDNPIPEPPVLLLTALALGLVAASTRRRPSAAEKGPLPS
jgi:hypothetical protein